MDGGKFGFWANVKMFPVTDIKKYNYIGKRMRQMKEQWKK